MQQSGPQKIAAMRRPLRDREMHALLLLDVLLQGRSTCQSLPILDAISLVEVLVCSVHAINSM
jgi:hypothetical protein